MKRCGARLTEGHAMGGNPDPEVALQVSDGADLVVSGLLMLPASALHSIRREFSAN